MDIMVEFHGLWSLPAAKKIAHSLEEFDTFWHEDPVRTTSLSSLIEYQEFSRAPVCASETIAGMHGFRDLLDGGFRGYVMADVGWCGGISAARNISAMADAYDLPVTFHDCTGPVVLAASVHLAQYASSAVIQEFVRAAYYGWYGEVVTNLPALASGYMSAPEGHGLGLDLILERFLAKDVKRTLSKLE